MRPWVYVGLLPESRKLNRIPASIYRKKTGFFLKPNFPKQGKAARPRVRMTEELELPNFYSCRALLLTS